MSDEEHSDQQEEEEADDAEARDEAEADDEGGDEAEAGEDEGGDEPVSEDERLEQIDEQIRQARSQADDVMGGPDQEFHETGEASDEDDQAVAPPG